MNDETYMVLEAITQAGDKGIWVKTLKTKLSMHDTVLNRNIKALVTKKTIKLTKSVKFPTRKIYMLSELTPSIELTGGPWYSDNDLDKEFVESLIKLCLQVIKKGVRLFILRIRRVRLTGMDT